VAVHRVYTSVAVVAAVDRGDDSICSASHTNDRLDAGTPC